MRKSWWVSLLALVGLALLVRSLAAATSGVYDDEAYTYFISRGTAAQVLTGARPDLNMPTYYFMLHPLAGSTHNSFWLRLPSVLFGSLGVGVVLLFGRFMHDPLRGTLATLVTAVAYFSFLVDAQIRSYGLIAFFSTLLLWQYLAAREEERPPGGWSLYYLGCLLLPACHYLGAVLDAAVLLTLPLGESRSRARLALGPIVGIACSCAWLLFAVSGPTSQMHGHPRGPLVGDALHTPLALSGLLVPLYWPVLGLQSHLQWLEPLCVAIGWALLAYGLWRIHSRAPMRATILAVWLVLPLLVLTLGRLLGIGFYQHRYAAFLTGPMLFIAFSGLRRAGALSLAGLLFVANVLVLVQFPATPFFWNQDWQSVARFIEARQQKGDVAVFYVAYSLFGFDFYYHPQQIEADFSHPGRIALAFSPQYDGVRQIGLYRELLRPELTSQLGSGRVFLVFNQEDAVGGAEVRKWFAGRYGIADQMEIQGLNSWGNTVVYLLAPLAPARSSQNTSARPSGQAFEISRLSR
jgi:hypothetical protein